MYFILSVAFFAVLLGGAWWLLRRALNADEAPEPGGSFGDLGLGEKNTRRGQRERKRRRP